MNREQLAKVVEALADQPNLNVALTIHLARADQKVEATAVLAALAEAFGQPSGPDGPYGSAYTFDFCDDDLSVYVGREMVEEEPAQKVRLRGFNELVEVPAR